MGKVAIYVRVSSHKQLDKENEKNGGSLNNQWEICTRYMKQFGYSEKDFIRFEDGGKSAKTISGRDGLSSLIELIKKQNEDNEDYIEAICAYNLSRLSRSVKNSSEIYQLLVNNKVKLYLADGSCAGDINAPHTKFILNTLAALNEMYLDMLRESVIPGMKQSAEAGNYQGGTRPFGYNYIPVVNEETKEYKNMLIINEKEAEIVRRIFSMFIEGESLHAISKKLNQLGIKTTKNKRFKTTTVKQIIKNPLYIGKIVWGKKRLIGINENGVKKYEVTDVYDMDIEKANGKHEPIISEELYFKAMERMKKIEIERKEQPTSDARRGTKLKEFYSKNRRMFSNVLKCPNCNSRMTTSPSYYKRKDGSRVEKIYYKCNSYNAGDGRCNGYYSIEESKVYSLIREDFLSRLEFVYSLIKYYKSINSNDSEIESMSYEQLNPQKYSDLITLKNRKKLLEKKFKKIREEIIEYNGEDELIVDAFKEDLRDVSNKIKAINKEINTIEIELEKEKNQRILLMKDYKEQEKYNNLEEYFLNLPQMKQRELIEQVYKKISVQTEPNKRTHKTFKIKEIKYNEDFSIRKIVDTLGIDFKDFCKKLEKEGFEISPIIKHFENGEDFMNALLERDKYKIFENRINNFIQDLYIEYKKREERQKIKVEYAKEKVRNILLKN